MIEELIKNKAEILMVTEKKNVTDITFFIENWRFPKILEMSVLNENTRIYYFDYFIKEGYVFVRMEVEK